MVSPLRRLSFSLLLFGRVYSGMALALPGTAVQPTSFYVRSEPEIYTRYGLYDPTGPHTDVPGGSSPKLVPIAEVFLAMTRPADAAAGPTPAATGTPLIGGPGLALLPSGVYGSLMSATPTPTVNDDKISGSSNNPKPSKQYLILGGVIGGILFFTLCLYLLLDPKLTRRIFGCARFKRVADHPKPVENEKKKKINDTSSWITVTSLPNKRESLETIEEEDLDSVHEERHTIIDITSSGSNPPSPPSKFSVCSSEYPPSSLYSTSDRATTIAAGTPDKDSSTTSPLRPRRPPTADSPALSDSVYLACSDQPYVIVAPQPLTSADLQKGNAADAHEKILTPTEFLALASFIVNAPIDPVDDGLTRAPSDGRHSRTRSAPALGGDTTATTKGPSTKIKSHVPSRVSTPNPPKRVALPVGEAEDEDEAVSDSQDSIIRRVMKHRRSRSASGWAYPGRERRLRKPFKLEEM